MTFKQQAIAYLQDLPEDCTEEDLGRFLAVRRAVREGREDVRVGRVISQDEIEEMVERWLEE